MDQFKQVLAEVVKYHFWWLAVVAMLVSAGGWYSAKNALSADFLKGRDKVKASFDTVGRVENTSPHPNEDWATKVKDITGKSKNLVYEAWKMVYDEQRSKVLHWPADLGADFETTMQRLRPADEIPQSMREDYRNYILTEFVQLLKIVNAKSFDEKTVPTGDGVIKIDWDHDSQKRIFASLQWLDTPDSKQVRNAQENLWVYEALLTVIAKINTSSRDIHTSKIRLIESLSIGPEAGQEFRSGNAHDHIWHASGATTTTAAIPAAVPSNPQLGLTSGLGRNNDALNRSVSDEGRYVNEQGKPLEAGVSPSEFKRMPVHMRLVMDQREISKLLVELANSPLPVEVRQVRLRPERTARLGESQPSRVGVVALKNSDDKNPFELPVEIHGIIYIFNPPDRDRLGHPAESGEEGAAEGEKKPGQPAPGTPPAAPVATP